MHIAIVDDFPPDRKELSSMLELFADKNQLEIHISEFQNAEEFLENFNVKQYDLCFMDIHLEDIKRLDAAKILRLRNSKCLIIFFSAREQHVYKSYEIPTFRCLIKPAAPESLFEIMDLCVKDILLFQKKLSVTIGKNTQEIPYNKIMYVTIEGIHVKLHYMGGDLNLSSHRTFSEVVRPLLENCRFITSCRGVVVNLEHVKELSRDSFIMDDLDRVPISRRQYPAVRSAYMDFQFDHF